ncbi:serine O-acetyltransferase EpsC [Buchnera aphidicola]|uniref:serine O-acetyltransferase EpsC n=1 Tax=Buchnera aphidicola TaxID=9 RepID=UPI003463A30E
MLYEEVEIIWKKIYSETSILIKEEPYLYNFYNSYILKHNSLIDSMSYILADKLFDDFISRTQMKKMISKLYLHNPIMSIYAVQDINFIIQTDPVVNYFHIPFLYFKGFHALQGYRISNYLWSQGRKSLAMYFQSKISQRFSIDIHPAAKIGSGIILDHGTGIVIGETVVIENHVSILQSVTIGSRYSILGNRHPIIREGTIIGAGAKILGNIEIGSFSKIGSGAVVLNSVPSYSTVVGIPGKIISKSHNEVLNPINQNNSFSHSIDFQYGSGI